MEVRDLAVEMTGWRKKTGPPLVSGRVWAAGGGKILEKKGLVFGAAAVKIRVLL
jgi:hypothetical protein